MVKPQGDCANTHTGSSQGVWHGWRQLYCCTSAVPALCVLLCKTLPLVTLSQDAQLSGTLTSTGHGAVVCAWGGLWPLLLNMARDTPVLVKSFFFT